MVRRVSSVIFVQGFLQAFSMSGRKHKTIVWYLKLDQCFSFIHKSLKSYSENIFAPLSMEYLGERLVVWLGWENLGEKYRSFYKSIAALMWCEKVYTKTLLMKLKSQRLIFNTSET